jgi:dUTP pyrophosphatase
MDELEIKFKKTHKYAQLPTTNTHAPKPIGFSGANAMPESGIADSGYDLYSVEDIRIHPHKSAVVGIGLTLAYITPGYWFRIEGRSGLGFKHGIQPHFGIIDNQYRGDLGVKLYNLSDVPYDIKSGDRIAQMVVYKLYEPIVGWSDEVSSSGRMDAGFGSTGK